MEQEIQASILGNEVSSHDIKKKKEQLEEMKAYNFFSSLGKKIAEIVSDTTEKIIEFIVSLIQDIMSRNRSVSVGCSLII